MSKQYGVQMYYTNPYGQYESVMGVGETEAEAAKAAERQRMMPNMTLEVKVVGIRNTPQDEWEITYDSRKDPTFQIKEQA